MIALAASVLGARAQDIPASCGDKWRIASDDLFALGGSNHYRLLRNVQVECDDVQLYADQAEIFSDLDRVRATGNVLFVSGTSRISADRLDFNTKTKTGTFYVASGIANLENRGIDRSLFGTQEPDAYFFGETIEKIGPKTYRISHGGFTTCVQPTPRWEMVASSVTLTLEKRAVMTNMVLKVKDVPVFYLPAMYYPINKADRATGFLIPIYGSSTIQGQTLRNAFFWAINRSNDATLYHNFYSKTGQSFGGEYRYVQSAGSSGNFQTSIVREHEATYDNTDGTQNVVEGIDSYTITGTVLQQLPARLRLTGNANYFSSLIAQQRYQQNITAATNRTRSFGVNLAGNWGANSVSGTLDRNETFSSDTNYTIAGSRPRINYTRSEKRIAGLPIYVGANSEYVQLVRTAVIQGVEAPGGLTRIDVVPTVRVPFTKLQFLTFNSSMRFHETYWSESRDDEGARVPVGVQRRYFELATSITGPVFQKIYNTPGSTYAQKFKHVIEPGLVISRKTRITNTANIIPLEGTDFVLGGHTDYTYGIANRIYAKQESSREILNIAMVQTYYTDENASKVDFNYQSTTNGVLPPSHFSPLAFQIHASPTTVTDATVRLEYDTHTGSMRSIAANGGLSRGWAFVNAGWSLVQSVPTKVNEEAVTVSHYLTSNAMIRKPGNAWSGSYAFNFDMKNKDFVDQRIIAHYNTQCCGLAIEYQKFNFGTRSGQGVPVNHRFNLSFTLAGIGTFSDLFGAFGGQQGR